MKEISLDIFPRVSKDDWLDLAKKQLKGDDPIQALGWLSDSHLKMNSYYDQTDIEALKDQIEFFGRIEPFSWKLYEAIEVKNEREANKQAVEALAGGCDGIVFSVQEGHRL